MENVLCEFPIFCILSIAKTASALHPSLMSSCEYFPGKRLTEYKSDTVNSTVSGHRQFRVNFRKRYLFFPNGIVFRYFDYPVIFSNLLAAWNVMLAVETWYIEVLITKCLTVLLYGKVKVSANYLNVTAKTLIWSRNFSKTCINYIYICR